jgi:hypothetical protein
LGASFRGRAETIWVEVLGARVRLCRRFFFWGWGQTIREEVLGTAVDPLSRSCRGWGETIWEEVLGTGSDLWVEVSGGLG